MDNGVLKASVTNEKLGIMRQAVGSTLRPVPGQPGSYALYLETGTRKMAPRPWLQPGLARNARRLNTEANRRFRG